MPRPRSSFAARLAASSAILTGLALGGCSKGSGGDGTAAVADAGVDPLAIGQVSGTVRLPDGSPLTLGSLQINDSLATASVAADGSFTLTAFVGGPHLVIVTSAGGHPVLMGWLSPTSTVIDDQSTAAALTFFGAGCMLLPADVRMAAIALIPSDPRLPSVTSAVDALLRSTADPTVTTDPGVIGAVDSLTGAHPLTTHALTVSTLDGTSGSGLDVIQEFPDGVHFINNYRRRAEAFVDRVSYVDASGATIPSPAAVTTTPFPIPPVSGVSQGAITTFADILSGTYAFSPITTGAIALPSPPGAIKTTYTLTVVGPGTAAGAYASVPASYQSAADQTAALYFTVDVFIPLVANVLLPANSSAIDDRLQFEGGTAVVQDIVSTLFGAIPVLKTDLSQGKYEQAVTDGLNAFTTLNTVNAALQQKVLDFTIKTAGIDAQQVVYDRLARFNALVQGINYGLAAFDASVLGSEIAKSNRADRWQIVAVPDKTTLTPPTTTVADGSSVTFTGVDTTNTGGSAVPLSYQWTNTAKFGHLTDGVAGHQDNFTSTKATVTYTANASGAGTDTIGLQIATLQSPGSPSTPLGQPLSATVSVASSDVPTITLSPTGCFQLTDSGGTQSFTATVAGGPPGLSYQVGWALSGLNAQITLDAPGATKQASTGEMVGPSLTASVTVPPRNSMGAPPIFGSVTAIRAEVWYVNSKGQLTNTFAGGKTADAATQIGEGNIECSNPHP